MTATGQPEVPARPAATPVPAPRQEQAGPALEVRDLTVRYGRSAGRGAKTPPAVDGVSFGIAPGETLGLVGESGSGKSTIGKAILGLAPATSGRILLHGTDITRTSLRKRRAVAIDLRVVFQDPYSSLNPAQTIGQTLTEPLRVLLVPKEQRRARAAEALAAVGLPADAIARYPAQFSGGQRQRIAIARALVCDPQVIVLDEPVSALDVSTQAQVLNLLADLRDARGLALLFIAHDLGVVRFLAQRVVVLYRGQVMETGGVEEVTQRPRHPYSIALTAAAPVPQPAEQARRRAAREALGIGTAGATPPAAGGCPFATRCPLVTGICRTERVPLTPAGDGSASAGWAVSAVPAVNAVPAVACHHAGQAAGMRLAAGVSGTRSLPDFFPSSPGDPSCSSFPTASCGASPAPGTRTRAATPTATPGSPSTCSRRCSVSRRGGRATAGNCGAKTSTWRRG